MKEFAIRPLVWTALLALAIKEQHYRILLRPSPLQILKTLRMVAIVMFAVVLLHQVVAWSFAIPDATKSENDYQQMSFCLSEQLDMDPYGAHVFTKALELCERRLGLR